MYIVPNVPLIPQTLNMACWYASAQMLVQWRRDKTQSSDAVVTDPSENSETMQKWAANAGISDDFILKLVADLGLVAIPPMSPTIEAIGGWLNHYGPLWINGSTHITVIAGVDFGYEKLFIHNPAPVNIGKREWRSMDWLGGVGSATGVDSLDPNANAGSFLHCPG